MRPHFSIERIVKKLSDCREDFQATEIKMNNVGEMLNFFSSKVQKNFRVSEI